MAKNITITIAEAFPVSHDYTPGPGKCKGPFYAPGAVFYHAPQRAEYVERCAEAMRACGWTVTVGSAS